MFNYLIWLMVVILYIPVFKIFYTPIWNGLREGPYDFLKAFGKPWGDVSDYTHAYFILPISLWLVWQKRKILKRLYEETKFSKSKDIVGFFIFLVGILLYIWGWYQDYTFIYTLSLIPFLYGLIRFLYGTDISKELIFPVFYLLFLVPPPAPVLDEITLPLRYLSSIFAESILNFLNYPVIRDGLLLTIGYNEIFMAPPCSGFRSLITMLALVLIYIYKSRSQLKTKIVISISIIPFAMFGNIIRVIMLCLITFYFGEEAGEGFFHNFSGIIVFIFTILGVIGLEILMEKRFVRKEIK